jgi:hypothetical protein
MRWLTNQTVQFGRSVTIVVLTIVKANIYSNSFRLLVAPWCNALGVQTYLAVQHWRTDIVDRDQSEPKAHSPLRRKVSEPSSTVPEMEIVGSSSNV